MPTMSRSEKFETSSQMKRECNTICCYALTTQACWRGVISWWRNGVSPQEDGPNHSFEYTLTRAFIRCREFLMLRDQGYISLNRHLQTTAAKPPVKYQGNLDTLTCNLTAARIHGRRYLLEYWTDPQVLIDRCPVTIAGGWQPENAHKHLRQHHYVGALLICIDRDRDGDRCPGAKSVPCHQQPSRWLDCVTIMLRKPWNWPREA